MAEVPKTKFYTDNNLTRKRWAKDLYRILLKNVEFNDLVGSSNDSAVQIKNDLGKGKGDTITFGIRLLLQQKGIVGDNPVEGNEEKLRFRDFNMTIQEVNFAVDTGGRMEEQRVPYDLMREAKDALQELWADRLSDLMFQTLAGNSDYTWIPGTTTFANAITEPDVGHFMCPGHTQGNAVATAEAALTSSDIMTTDVLDAAKQLAEVPYNEHCFRLRPFVIGGKKYFIVYLHNFVFDKMVKNFNPGELGVYKEEAKKIGIMTGEIVYNNLVIRKTERLPKVVDGDGTYDGVYRGVLLGKQAACWAWGGAGETKTTTMAFTPYKKDAERFTMVRGGGILGMKKTRFNSSEDETGTWYDYGVIVLSAWGDRFNN